MAITYALVQEYLDKIADQGNKDATNSVHGRFWNTDYNSFINGSIPNLTCDGTTLPAGANIPIIDKVNPANSAFLSILKGPGFCSFPEMPYSGPFVAGNFKITLADGTVVPAAKILSDLQVWLQSGFPK